MRTLVVVGACYLDTILTVPHYPEEDSKLRASSLIRRRGGNGPNTIEVIQQLFDADRSSPPPAPPTIISILSCATSSATRELISSLPPQVDWSRCIYRGEHDDPASSFIVKSEATSSRTIVNHNPLPEMTAAEFTTATEGLDGGDEGPWFHFEGRIPDVTIECIRHVRARFPCAMVSVEVEKPGRPGLQDLADAADVVFYSRSWAQGEGYRDALECLLAESERAGQQEGERKVGRPDRFCTWGEQGALMLSLHGMEADKGLQANGPVVDTVGAGDTFIAGALYALIAKGDRWPPEKILGFANELAGHKVYQDGLKGLAEKVAPWLR